MNSTENKINMDEVREDFKINGETSIYYIIFRSKLLEEIKQKKKKKHVLKRMKGEF